MKDRQLGYILLQAVLCSQDFYEIQVRWQCVCSDCFLEVEITVVKLDFFTVSCDQQVVTG